MLHLITVYILDTSMSNDSRCLCNANEVLGDKKNWTWTWAQRRKGMERYRPRHWRRFLTGPSFSLGKTCYSKVQTAEASWQAAYHSKTEWDQTIKEQTHRLKASCASQLLLLKGRMARCIKGEVVHHLLQQFLSWTHSARSAAKSSKKFQEQKISGVVLLPAAVTILDKWQDSSFRHKGLIHVENLRILLFDHIMNRTHVKPRRIADTTCKISSPKPNATAKKFMLAFIFWSTSNPLKIGFHNKKTTRQICRL